MSALDATDVGAANMLPFLAPLHPDESTANEKLLSKKSDDVVLSLRDDTYRNVILKFVGILNSGSAGNLKSLHGNVIHTKAKKALNELNSGIGSGRFLKAIQRGKGNSPVIGYSLESDNDVLKKIKHDLYQKGYDQRRKSSKASAELAAGDSSDDDSSFSDSDTELPKAKEHSQQKNLVHPEHNDAVFSFRDDTYKTVIVKHAGILSFKTLPGKSLTMKQRSNNGFQQRQEAREVLNELKRQGGNLLKPVLGGKGRSPIIGYSHFESDDEALDRIIRDLKDQVYGTRKKKAATNDNPIHLVDIDSDDDSVDSSQAVTNERNYIYPKEGDVILSLTDESYKAKAFISFRLLGEKGPKLSGKEKEVSSKMLNEFKAGMMRSGGRFIKCASATRSKKRYYAVNDAEALRTHRWIRCNDGLAEESPIKKRKKNKSTSLKNAQPTAIRQGGRRRRNQDAARPPKPKVAVLEISSKTSTDIGDRGQVAESKTKPAVARDNHRKSGCDKPIQAKAGRNSDSASSVGDLEVGADNEDVQVTGASTKPKPADDAYAQAATVSMEKLLPVYNDIKEKLLHSKDNREKKFYGHLKRFFAQRLGNGGLLLSDFNRIQDAVLSFLPKMEMLNDATDFDDICVYGHAIEEVMKNCEEKFPVK